MVHLIVERRLDEATLSEVLARVAFAVAVREYWRPVGRELPEPDTFVLGLAKKYHRAGFPVLYSWLLSMAYYGRRGLPASQWRTAFVKRARLAELYRQRGERWRRVPPCY